MVFAVILFFVFVSCSSINEKPIQGFNSDFIQFLKTLIDSNELFKALEDTENSETYLAKLNTLRSQKELLNVDAFGFFPKGELLLNIGDKPFLSPGSTNTELRTYWDMDILGLQRKIYQSNKALVEAGENDLIWLDRLLKYQIALNYVTVAFFNRYKEIVADTCARLQDIYNVAEKKFTLGVLTKDQAILAKLEARLCEDELLRASLDILEAIKNIRGLYPSSSDFAFTLSLKDRPQIKTDLDVVKIAMSRPDVRAALKKMEAATKIKDASILSALPKITLEGIMSVSTDTLADIDPSDFDGYLAINFFQPLLSLVEKAFKSKSSHYLSLASLHEFNHAVNTVVAEVIWTINTLQVAKKRLDLLSEGVEEYREAVKISNMRFREGLSNLVEVLKVEANYFKFLTQKNFSEYMLVVSYLNLAKSVPNLIE